jgi:hypothetical protein
MRSKPKICFQENKKLQIITKHMSIIEWNNEVFVNSKRL